MPTLPDPCLLLLTDRTRLTPQWTLSQAVAPAVTGGVNLVVYGESDLPRGPRLSVWRFLRDGVRGRAPLLFAGDPALALEAGADGVHLETEEISVGEVRAALGPDRLIGVTVRTLEEARRAEAEGADYLLIAADWSDSGVALEVVRHYVSAVALPVVVGVDMTPEQAALCRAAGAGGVAVCEAGMSAYDRTAAAQAYVEVLGAKE